MPRTSLRARRTKKRSVKMRMVVSFSQVVGEKEARWRLWRKRTSMRWRAAAVVVGIDVDDGEVV